MKTKKQNVCRNNDDFMGGYDCEFFSMTIPELHPILCSTANP